MSRRSRVSAACRRGAGGWSIGGGGAVGGVTHGRRGRAGRCSGREVTAASSGRVESLLRRMTLRREAPSADAALRRADEGPPGGGAQAGRRRVLSETDPVLIDKYQHDAVENSRLHIPILFAFDTIHGFRTIFPIPLATASSFDPDVAFTDHRIGAFESAAVGIKQIYSPMVDVSHEPRWGRIVEAAGEDPYLNSVMAAVARLAARRAATTRAPDKVVTSVKHFVAYGQPESGRDYNTTDMSRAAAAELLPAAVQGRDRRRRGHRRCARSTRSTACPGCANTYTETRHPQGASGASTASSRATTPRSPSCAAARA